MTFDPYHKWLGIRDPQRPPDHYRLLGIEPFESDPDVVAAAADRQMAHVRKYQSGDRAEWSQKLLNEIAAAKICLLTADAKNSYDANLRSTTASIAESDPRLLMEVDASQWLASQRPKRKRLAWWLAGSVLVAIIIAAAYLGLRGTIAFRGERGRIATNDSPSSGQPSRTLVTPDTIRGSSEATVDSKGAASEVASNIDRLTGEGIPPSDENQPADQYPSSDASDEAAILPRQDDSQVTQTQDQAQELTPSASRRAPWERPHRPHRIPAPPSPKFAAVYQAMSDRSDFRKHLQDLGKQPLNLHDRETLSRLRLQAEQLATFWQAVEGGLSVISRGAQLDYNGEPVTVLDATEQWIELESASGHVRKFSVQRKNMPGDLVVAIANQGWKPSTSHHWQLVSFLIFDRLGNSSRAEELIANETQRGHRGDFLLAGVSQVPFPTDQPLVTAGSIAIPSQRQPLPSSESVAAAMVAVNTKYKVEKRAKSAEARRELARVMFLKAQESGSEPPTQFVLLELARKLATILGDRELAWQSLVQLDDLFEIEDGTITSTISGLNRRMESNGSVLALFADGQELLDSLIDEARFETANSVAESLVPVARRTKVASRVDELVSLREEVHEMASHYDSIAAERKLVDSDAANTTANDAVGNFLLVIQGRCKDAIPYLKRGSNPALRELAELDEGSGGETVKVILAADGWWNLAESLRSYAAHRVRKYAIHLYEVALSTAPAAERTRIEQVLLEFETLYPPVQSVNLEEVLLASEWIVEWSSGSVWKSVKFLPGGKCTIRTESKVNTMSWTVVDASTLLIRPETGTSNYFAKASGRRILWGKVDGITGQRLLTGLGKKK